MLLELVLSQIQAWNRADLKDFLSYYHEDVKVYSQPAGEVIFGSRAALLPHIQADFETGSVERVNVMDQLESKPYVLLLEEKGSGKDARRAVVTYFIEDGKIKSMWIERVESGTGRISQSSIDGIFKCDAVLGRNR